MSDLLPKHVDEALVRLAKLEKFYKKVAHLTLNHDVQNDHAVIYASKLGAALEEIDKDWWKQ